VVRYFQEISIGPLASDLSWATAIGANLMTEDLQKIHEHVSLPS
jgi:hypothetical protein